MPTILVGIFFSLVSSWNWFPALLSFLWDTSRETFTAVWNSPWECVQYVFCSLNYIFLFFLAVFIDLPILFPTTHYIVTRLLFIAVVHFIFLLTILASNDQNDECQLTYLWINGELWARSYYLESSLLDNSPQMLFPSRDFMRIHLLPSWDIFGGSVLSNRGA